MFGVCAPSFLGDRFIDRPRGLEAGRELSSVLADGEATGWSFRKDVRLGNTMNICLPISHESIQDYDDPMSSLTLSRILKCSR